MQRLPWSFYLQVTLCAALWGSAFPVIKLSYESLAIEGFGERMAFAGVRFTLAGLFIMPFCRHSVLATIREAPKGKLVWVILGQTYFQYLFFYYALSISSGTLGALLGSSGSFLWVVLAPVFLKTPKPTGRHWLVLLACSVGIAIAVYAPGAGSGQVLLGSAMFLLAALSGALGAIGLKLVSAEFGSRTVTALSLFIGGGMLYVTGASGWSGFWKDIHFDAIWPILYLSFLSATAFTLWNRLIERYSVNVLSAYRFLIPLCGVIESALFIEEETIGLGIVVGGVLVLASLVAMGRLPLGETASGSGRTRQP
ncbi:DMT family transporter [Pelagicoccus sp. SDUM812003]|uniref:DMT family transporter n=1 Tax=Pelagicoccus sp. SDUM812003 TaxID=3041267 RepID=UPI00280E5A26|nr:DMT family transporter [Pelagicoccus sp. SDUM812003]MDQ8201869.1 DMT family transporter [Pelagicoccus sp. SDUM812003]